MSSEPATFSSSRTRGCGFVFGGTDDAEAAGKYRFTTADTRPALLV
jgi:hypothetical protein